jgi:hypothetical protein
LVSEIGFDGVNVVKKFDSFGGTSKERIARKYGVIGVNLHARKP